MNKEDEDDKSFFHRESIRTTWEFSPVGERGIRIELSHYDKNDKRILVSFVNVTIEETRQLADGLLSAAAKRKDLESLL